MQNKITLRDIAKKTGFSINTVSLALKDNPLISIKTKNFIKKNAKEMGYIPDKIAGSLRSGKTKTIAFIIPDILNPLFAIWAKIGESVLRAEGYDMLIMNTDEDYNIENQAIYLALSKKVDGIIICPTQHKTDIIKFLIDIKVPFILIGRHFRNIDTDYVIMNDYKGSFLATEHLIERNRRKIIYINAYNFITAANERRRGYEDALKKYNIEIREELVKTIDIVDPRSCFNMIKDIKKKNIEFDAIFAWSDWIALKVINFLQKFNLKVPKDVAVVGFDNIRSYLFFPYKITSVSYSSKDLISKSISILLKKILNPSLKLNEHIIIDTKLVKGNSS